LALFLVAEGVVCIEGVLKVAGCFEVWTVLNEVAAVTHQIQISSRKASKALETAPVIYEDLRFNLYLLPKLGLSLATSKILRLVQGTSPYLLKRAKRVRQM
jgi:hypothetical protein